MPLRSRVTRHLTNTPWAAGSITNWPTLSICSSQTAIHQSIKLQSDISASVHLQQSITHQSICSSQTPVHHQSIKLQSDISASVHHQQLAISPLSVHHQQSIVKQFITFTKQSSTQLSIMQQSSTQQPITQQSTTQQYSMLHSGHGLVTGLSE